MKKKKVKRKKPPPGVVLNQLSLFDDIGNSFLQDHWKRYTWSLYQVREIEKKKKIA